VKFHSFSRYLVAFLAALLLGSCGGGGGATTPDVGGPIQVDPDGATLYAGVRATFTIVGGKPPYILTSTEPALLPVPATVDGHSFDVIPNNPSVVDAGLPPEALPVRTVIITARAAGDASTDSATVKVARNFLTGYGFSFGATTCASQGACAGGETTIAFDSTFVGNLQPNHTYRIERVRGPFQFIDPLNTNNQTDSIVVTSDSSGRFTAVIRVATGVPTQIAILRVTDVATGAQSLFNFTISAVAPTTGALTVIPATVSLTGPNGTTCGFGTFDVLVFDGVAPYTAVCPNPQMFVSNSTSNTQPGRFTVTVGASSACLAAEQCVITDALGARTTFAITTVKGTTTPPPALVVSPSSMTLLCGQSGNATVVGGNGNYTANSSHPRVTAGVSGNTVTVTRVIGDGATVYPATGTVSITDGSSIVNITVTVPTNCT